MLAASHAMRMRHVLDRRLTSHPVVAVEQIDAGASGRSPDKRTICTPEHSMPDLAFLSKIDNLVSWTLNPTCSSPALADVPPWRPPERRREQSDRLPDPYSHHWSSVSGLPLPHPPSPRSRPPLACTQTPLCPRASLLATAFRALPTDTFYAPSATTDR